ncbi:MAG TPA: TetR/AcrR family transcriptional regulator [Acidimicrobiales bacterium]
MSNVASTRNTAGPSARERLLNAASDLFYAEGVQTVGIDRIIERAGVAKASLYNLFGSKEELVAAYLATRHENTRARLERALSDLDSPREKILAVFAVQATQVRQPDFNGCAFIAASTEAPAGGLVEHATDEYRHWLRQLFTDLARDAGASDPDQLGQQLHLIYDGVGISARTDHRDVKVCDAARRAVTTLLDTQTPSESNGN